MLGLQEHITFKEDTHQYFDPQGVEYASVSSVLATVIPKFDRAKISGIMAMQKAKAEGISQDQAQEIILGEWDKKKNSAIDWGNWIHGNLEKYMLEGTCDSKLLNVGGKIARFLSKYYKWFPEAIIYDSEYLVSGTADLPVQRQKTKIPVVDFWDYKTNEAKGIYYDSIKRDQSGAFKKHYNQFLEKPLDHLEHCNYNIYALQLSVYAVMAENTFHVRPGRMGIIFIDKNLKAKIIPVPYLKMEAIALLKHFKDRNKSGWEE